MKIAFVHDYIKEYGGAERVLETLHEMYPDAPVYTLVYCPEFLGPHKDNFKNWDIRPSFLQYIPFKEKLISPFRLLAPFIFPLFNFSGYDVIMVSATGAYSPNTIHKKSAKQLCYYHTPPRYLYGFATAREWKKNPFIKLLTASIFTWLRKIDRASSKNIDIAIANSQNVAERIKKFYKKDAVVIYPPVEIQRESRVKNQESRQYYLAGGRLARPKHIELIIEAANALQIPLRVFGKGFAGYGEDLKKIAGPTVDFVGEVTDEEKTVLMARAKAYLFAAEDEDFGMLPVEAMAVGTPVIAYKSGGPKESLVDGKTGIFFQELSVKSIIEAVKRLERAKISKEECIKQAKKFSKENFIKHIHSLI